MIIVSTFDDRQKGAALGAHAFGVKPVTKDWLLATLETVTAPAAPSIKILAVDDEETYRFILREMLSDTGYLFAEASSAEEAIELIRRFPPDVVLLDVRMAGMSGIDLWEHLIADRGAAAIPVILVTSQQLSPDEHRRIGPDAAVLSKTGLTRERLHVAIEIRVGAPLREGCHAPVKNGARIVVVDDQDAGRFVKVQILRRAGFAVEEAATGSDALAIVDRQLPT